MYRLFRSRSKKAGLSPGTLMHVGEQKTETVKISFIDYNATGHFTEGEVQSIDQLISATDPATVTWINVAGLHQIAVMKSIGQQFGIHPLLLEDILNTDQRPKIDQHDNYLYLIVKMIHWRDNPGEIETEQVSIVLGKTFVLTFQEQEKDIFDPLRQRIRDGTGRIRQAGADYLAYALLDIIVDHYFVILENMGEDIELVEEELVTDPNPDTLQKIHQLKREMLYLRRSVWPLREVIGGLQRGDAPLFQPETLIYLRDVYEHTIQVIDTVETFRDIVSGLLDIYLSSLSNKMNEVMKVLTVIATIFIPLTFFTSLYGMNFRFMPELEWRWSYPALWAVMLVISGAMLLYFKKKDWI
jgi:magnesium transporter